MMTDDFECPVCGVHHLKPRWPHPNGARWGDCACSDDVTCVCHQVSYDDAPTRPTQEVLDRRAEETLAWKLVNWHEKAGRGAKFQVMEHRILELERQIRVLEGELDQSRRQLTMVQEK